MSEPMSTIELVAEAKPVKWTERAVLDVLHQRLGRIVNGNARRYIVAEHVGLNPTWPRRIIDAVAVDTWASGGYSLDGYEVKISRSDLRREVLDPSKSGAWDGLIDTFTIVAPFDVLRDWQQLGMPDTWGVLAVYDLGQTRMLRQPAGRGGYEACDRTVQRAVLASLMRAADATARRRARAES